MEKTTTIKFISLSVNKVFKCLKKTTSGEVKRVKRKQPVSDSTLFMA